MNQILKILPLIIFGLFFTGYSNEIEPVIEEPTQQLVLLTLTKTNQPPTPNSTNTPSPTHTPEPTHKPEWGCSSEDNYSLVNQTCSSEECLFISDSKPCRDHPVGITKVSGYYIQLEREAWGTKSTCDSFVILSSSEILITSIFNKIEAGNAVNILASYGNPIVGLDLSPLSESEIDLLLSSSKENLVDMTLIALPPIHAGVPVCFSPFELLGIEKAESQ